MSTEPEWKSAQRTMILILVNPAVTLLGHNHQFIIAKARIDKCINKCACKISASRVNIRRDSWPYDPQSAHAAYSSLKARTGVLEM